MDDHIEWSQFDIIDLRDVSSLLQLIEVVKMAEPKKEKNGTWMFVLDAGRKPDGSRHQIRRRGFKNKREALNAQAQLKAELLEGSYVDTSKIRIHDFMEEWLLERKNYVEPETYVRDYGLFKNHISTTLGNFELQKITPIMMQKFINKLTETLAASTVNIIYSLLNQIFKKAITFKLIKDNPLTGIKHPKGNKNSALKVWDESQIRTFIEQAKKLKIGQRYYIGYVILLMTGMRRGEVLGLNWNDVDLDNGLIYVRQILSSQTTQIKERTKTEAGTRTISIPNMLIELLKEHKEILEIEKHKYRYRYEDSGLVMRTLYGKAVDPKNFYKTFKEMCKQLELPAIRIHDLRHTHATLLIAQNVNPKIISERLGHNDIGVTLDIYSHVLPSMQKEVADKIDEVFKD